MGGVILMPYYHCRKCHHEFENIPYEGVEPKCDWCGADKPHILEDQTPLERMCENWQEIMEMLEETTDRILKEKNNGDIR